MASSASNRPLHRKDGRGWSVGTGPLVVVLAMIAACQKPVDVSPSPASVPRPENEMPEIDKFAEPRALMVTGQLQARDITNPRVLATMKRIPRHKFVPPGEETLAYEDSPLPIGHGQTISQPYIVALMTQLVDPQPGDKALDVGTGSGYQAAVLAELVKRVYSIEIVEPLAREAGTRLKSLGYDNVEVRHGDGYRGWPEAAPFDIIIVAAAPDHIPDALIEQLADGGKMVIPVGRYFQDLLLIEKSDRGVVSRKSVAPVAFVPMTGEAEETGPAD